MTNESREADQQEIVPVFGGSSATTTRLAVLENGQSARGAAKARAIFGLALLAFGAAFMTGVIPFSNFSVSPSPILGPSKDAAISAVSPTRYTATAFLHLPRSAGEAQLQPLSEPSLAGLLQPVQTSDMARAINGMWFGELEKSRLRRQVAAGDVRVAWIVLSDWDAEDGDSVTVSAAGYSQFVRLYHRPTTLAVPYRIGEPLTVMGAVDGDNRGVTVAVYAGRMRVPLSMRLGATVQVPTP